MLGAAGVAQHHGSAALTQVDEDVEQRRVLLGLMTQVGDAASLVGPLVGGGFGQPCVEMGEQVGPRRPSQHSSIGPAGLVDRHADKSTSGPEVLNGPDGPRRPGSLGVLMLDARVTVHVSGNHLMSALVGEQDRHLRQVESAFPDTSIHVRGNVITCEGDDAARVGSLFEELVAVIEAGQPIETATIERSIDMIRADERPSQVLGVEVLKVGGRTVRPKSAGQKRYVEAMQAHTITFGLGPAGTGKSWLAVAMAVDALLRREVDRIILTRPAVEAGERLGFLPGDLMAKIDPYLRPLYDALNDMLDAETVAKLVEKGAVEVAPLAFMRGRTLNRSFIILDEAQNTSPEQMKMFLTRIGFGSKAVVTGDMSQVDVPGGRNGLVGLEAVLGVIDGLVFVHLGKRDVVRHRIVQDIVEAYERADSVTGRSTAAERRARPAPRSGRR